MNASINQFQISGDADYSTRVPKNGLPGDGAKSQITSEVDRTKQNMFPFTPPGKKESLKGEWNDPLTKESPGVYQSF